MPSQVRDRMRDGRITEITAYLDTDLLARIFA